MSVVEKLKTDKDIKKGTHFWATLDGKLVAIIKEGQDEYYVCGSWECALYWDDMTFIEKIEKPNGHQSTPLYYDN